jgi:methylated-DNA-[protein]-cysteine S-methyltransferase
MMSDVSSTFISPMSVPARPDLIETTLVVSPELGALRFIATDDALVALYFDDHRRPRPHATRILDDGAHHPVVDAAALQVDEYVRGSRDRFTIPLAPAGTAFQRAVWAELAAIPFGETRSYEDIARAIDRPRAVRAVGAANALNPIAIVVPCHRVIGKDGTLTGYAGGVERKAWLLAHERGRIAVTERAVHGRDDET